MATDAQGHVLSGGTQEAAAVLDDAVRAFTLSYGDANALLANAAGLAPDCAMVHLAKAWVMALSNDPVQLEGARKLVDACASLPRNEREATHLAALRKTADGAWPTAAALVGWW